MSNVRFRYQSIEVGASRYHLRTLQDLQQCPDDFVDTPGLGVSSATWPLFGVLWQAEKVLSQLMATEKVDGLRVLEVGCGTGLASMVLQRRGTDITATDYHPDGQEYLTANTNLNNLESIRCVCLNWHETDLQLGQFDLIIGSDLLYDRHAVTPLVSFLDTHAKPSCRMVIVDPQRGLSKSFARQIEALGFGVDIDRASFAHDDDESKQHLVMRFSRCKRRSLPTDTRSPNWENSSFTPVQLP